MKETLTALVLAFLLAIILITTAILVNGIVVRQQQKKELLQLEIEKLELEIYILNNKKQ